MAVGYVRQSAASIVTGLTVEAAPINAELNKLRDFSATVTGHNHDGTTGGGAKVHLVDSVDTTTKLRLQEGGTNADLSSGTTGSSVVMGASALTFLKNNFSGIVAPTVSDDSSGGYAVGSQWVDTTVGYVYICTNAGVSVAVWVRLDVTTGLAAVIGAVKVTTADTGPSVLNSAITVSGALTKSVVSPGADETLNLSIAAATDTVAGAVELATDAETVTGTDTVRAVVPASLVAALKTGAIIQALVGISTAVASGTTAAVAFARYNFTGSATITLPTFAAGEWIIVEFGATAGLTCTIGRNGHTIDAVSENDTCITKGPILLYYCASTGVVVSKFIGRTP